MRDYREDITFRVSVASEVETVGSAVKKYETVAKAEMLSGVSLTDQLN